MLVYYQNSAWEKVRWLCIIRIFTCLYSDAQMQSSCIWASECYFSLISNFNKCILNSKKKKNDTLIVQIGFTFSLLIERK